MQTVFIYGLACPVSGQLRYIGKCKNLKDRFTNHFSPYALSKSTRKVAWIKELLAQNLKPEQFVIDEVDKSHWQESEQFYIAYFKFIGCDLVNYRLGGIGGMTAPEINRFSSLSKGRKLSPEHIESIRKANTGRVNSREAIEKTSAAKRGKKRSPETIAKLKATYQSKSPEEKEKLLRLLRAPKSAEARAKMSAAAKNRKKPTTL